MFRWESGRIPSTLLTLMFSSGIDLHLKRTDVLYYVNGYSISNICWPFVTRLFYVHTEQILLMTIHFYESDKWRDGTY